MGVKVMEREVFERAKGLDDRIKQIDSVLKIRKNLCISINSCPDGEFISFGVKINDKILLNKIFDFLQREKIELEKELLEL